jgi:diaminopimelate decarboxylase
MGDRTVPLAPESSTVAPDTTTPWPSSARFDLEGLRIGGLPAGRLAGRYGTPLLVFDRADLVSRLRSARRAFPRTFYAVKAFTSHALLRLAIDEGLDLLAASGGEVEACLRAGVPAPRIALHGRNKTDDELELAVRSRIGLLIVDGLDELLRTERIASVSGTVQPFLLRVNPGVGVDTHEAIATGHEATAFGAPIHEVHEVMVKAAALSHVRFEGLHAHIGSQVPNVAPFLEQVDVLLELAADLRRHLGLATELLDIGGGFGITYTDERMPGVGQAAATVIERITFRCAELGLPVPLVAAEPGRSVVGNPGITLYRVGDRRVLGNGRTAITVDGGMSDNIRPMLYDAPYTVALANRSSAVADVMVTVVGRHCESGDVLADAVPLPGDVGPGDLLAFAATGAYTYPLASTYNRVGRPAVVAVEDARSALWLRREDAGDLDRLEAKAVRSEPHEKPPGIVFRPAQPRDARAFMSFWRAIVAEGGYVRTEEVDTPTRVYRARFRGSWSDREAQVMALDAGRVVGHVIVQREAHPVTRHVATLGIAVAADQRGRGIGAALMGEALRWAGSVGVEKIMLSVYPHNHAAIALYRRFGFVEEGRLVGHSQKSSGYQDEVLMSVWIGEERGG